MKEKIHPKYNIAKVICSTCGNEFEVGSVAQEIKVDTCSNCHPFYTGQQTFVQAQGRVEKRVLFRYRLRLVRAEDIRASGRLRSFVAKKLAQERGALVGAHAGIYRRAVSVALAEQIYHAAAGAGERVARTEYYGRYARIDYRAGAHGAGLERHIYCAAL